MWGGDQLLLVSVDELVNAHRTHPAVLTQNGDDERACCEILRNFVCASIAFMIWQYIEEFTVTVRGKMRYIDRRTYWRLLAVQTADCLEKSLLRQTTKRWFLTPKAVKLLQHPEKHGNFMLVQEHDSHLDCSTLNCWVESKHEHQIPGDATAVDAPAHTHAYMRVFKSDADTRFWSWEVWTLLETDPTFLCHLEGRSRDGAQKASFSNK